MIGGKLDPASHGCCLRLTRGVDVDGNCADAMLAAKTSLASLAIAIGIADAIALEQLDRVGSLASPILDGINAELDHLDEEVFSFGSRYRSVECFVALDLDHCSLPFP